MKNTNKAIGWAVFGYAMLGMLILYIIYTGKQVLG